MADHQTADDELVDRFQRIAARFQSLGGVDDPETAAELARLYLEVAMLNGWLALAAWPEAANYLTSTLRFDGAEDPKHAAMEITLRWRGGDRTPAEEIDSLKQARTRLDAEWRLMRSERNDSRRHGDELAAALRLYIGRESPGDALADAFAEQALVRALDAYTASRSGDA